MKADSECASFGPPSEGRTVLYSSRLAADKMVGHRRVSEMKGGPEDKNGVMSAAVQKNYGIVQNFAQITWKAV
jgi:hypothetical protein